MIYAENGQGILEEYIQFAQIFNEQRIRHKDEPDKMISEIFQICEERGLLQDYLKTHRSEVEKIMMTMVSPEYIEKAAGKTREIKGFIEAARLYGATDEDLVEKLVERFDITPIYAQNCLDADWDDDDL